MEIPGDDLNGVQLSGLTEVVGKLVHQVPDVLVRKGIKMESPMVSEPPFSPGQPPLPENARFDPKTPSDPSETLDQLLTYRSDSSKSDQICDRMRAIPDETTVREKSAASPADTENRLESAEEFVWRNLCRSFYVDQSTADIPEKTAQTARVDRSTQNEWKIPAVDQSTQSASTQNAVDQSTQNASAVSGEKDNGTPEPENIGGGVYTPVPAHGATVSEKKSAALPLQAPVPNAQAPIYPGLPRAGVPQVAPGHATMTGVQQRPIGLDKPQDTQAAAMPGMPGHAASNVIDQQGALDPRGLTVDGNNAASAIKFPKLAYSVAQIASQTLEAARAADVRRLKSALAAKQAAMAGEVGPPVPLGPHDLPGPADRPDLCGPRDLPGPAHPGAELIKQALGDPAWNGLDRLQKMRIRRGEPLDEQDQPTARSGSGSLIPNAALGLGAVSAGAMGLAHGMASDGQ